MTISHLIVFSVNPVEGKINNQLAVELGDEVALLVHKEMQKHTADVAKSVIAQRKCYYSEFVSNSDSFDDGHFEKLIQKGEDFGERLYTAAKTSFGEWASKVVIIGCDCYDLNAGIIEEAFIALDQDDFVIGPTKDGGFYLLGMKDLPKEMLLEKEWNHENVVLDLILEIQKQNKTHHILPTLAEVNTIADLPEDLKGFLEE